MNFEDISRVNSEISMIDLKGKDYAMVPERVTAFRKLFPEGFIKTEIISHDGTTVVMQAVAGYYDNGVPIILGSGLAQETKGYGMVNKTSYIENCETSACGRALGMCGFGIDTDVASAEEVKMATLQQEAEKPITAEKRKALEKTCKDEGIPESYICELYSVSELKELTEAKFVNLVHSWDKMKAKYNERKNN